MVTQTPLTRWQAQKDSVEKLKVSFDLRKRFYIVAFIYANLFLSHTLIRHTIKGLLFYHSALRNYKRQDLW